MFLRIFLICLTCVTVAMVGVPQARQQSRRPPAAQTPSPKQTPEPTPEPTPNDEPQEAETLKIDTNLVTVPVIATTIEGNYIPDLRQDEFDVSEDGQPQQVAFFATVSAPFHVVLLLDTSGSTKEKLGPIRQAAIAFVDQLQSGDRVKVISFDNQVRDLNEFTSDRAALRNAINKTTPGEGTKLYDAFEVALASIRPIKGRKAIVLFTDGVDYYSDMATFDGTLHGLDEEGVIVYPIRFETRAEAERMVREANDDPAANLPTIDVIRRAPSGTTPPTFPSDDPNSVPSAPRARTGPLGLPTADEIMRGRRGRDPDTDRYPGDRDPPTSGPNDPRGRGSDPRDTRSDPRSDPPANGRDDRGTVSRPTRPARRRDDSVGLMLDSLYQKADSYLAELANKSGGRLLRADTLGSLPDAFARIAAELRTQYTIGYYPMNKAHDGQYRKIRVTTTRKKVVVRSRPGYRAPSSG